MTRARDLADLISNSNTANGFVKLDSSSNLPALNGSAITNLNSANLTGDLPAISGASLTGIVAIETGSILTWSNSTVPSGFLECDGSAVSRTTYAGLFAVISTDYGSGDGSTTFNLPNLQDSVQVGVSSSKAVASTGGNSSVTPTGTLTVNNHTLTISELPSHAHDVTSNPHTGGGNSGDRPVAGNNGYPNNGIGATSHVVNFDNINRNIPYGDFRVTSNGSGSSHNHGGSVSINAVSTLQPYVAMKFMIKT
jgi:microcystin-dependent protein